MEIGSVFELFQDSNKKFVQSSIFLKRPIPYLYDSISFLASPFMVGSELDELISTVGKTCWNDDIQLRLVFAIVQAYGCGKTKMGLMLTKEFIMLPWRTLQNMLGYLALKKTQDTFKSVEPKAILSRSGIFYPTMLALS